MNRAKDETLLTEVKRQLSLCAGFEGDELQQNREDALKYYHQRPRGDEVPGRSAVVSGDVSSMVEANLSQMLEAFTGKALIEFDANDAADEDQAQLEADVCTRMVMGENNGFIHLAAAIKDILLLRNGIIRVAVEERTEIEIEKLRNATPEALAIIETDDDLKATVIRQEGDIAWIKRSVERRRFLAEAVPIENCLYTKNWHSLDLQDIPIFAERMLTSRSDLVALGCDKSKVAQLKRSDDTNATANARNPFSMPTASEGLDSSRDLVDWYRCFVLADRDGDGISERLEFWFSGQTVLKVEEVDLVPYAAGVAILNPHRLVGISIYDKLRQIQDLTTGLERALMDNVNTATKNRTAGLDGLVNKDDIDNGRPDGHIRVKRLAGDVRTALMAFNVPDLSVGILQNIDHQRSRRTEMGGAALELATGQMQLNDRVGSEGLDRAYSVMEQLAAMMTKLAAQTLLRSLFLLAHKTIRNHYDQPVKIKQNGRWREAEPSKWPERLSVTVKPGMSPGERQRRAGTLFQMLNMQLKLAELELDDILVNIEGFYQTLMDWARSLDVPNPEQYFVDPQSDPAKDAKARKEQQQAKLAEMQQTLMDQALDLEQTKVLLGKYKSDQETQWKYFDSVLGAEIEEAKLAGGGVIEYLKAKATAQAARAKANESEGASGAASE